MENKKTCAECHETKGIEDFYTDKGKPVARCKECKQKTMYKWRECNREKCKEATRLWRLANPEKHKLSVSTWHKENRDRYKEYFREWAKNNPDKMAMYGANAHKKRASDPKLKLSSNISCLVYYSLGKNKANLHWEKLVGFTVEQLVKHIEKQFLPGMSWENRSEWHIDHIIPVSAFNFEKPEDTDFKKCWSLKNLRPLWAEDNMKKNDKLENPYQPSLLLNE